MLFTLFFQNTNAVAQTVSKELSLLDLLAKGGPVIIVMGILSFIALYIFVERFIVIQKAGKIENTFMNKIKEQVVKGDIKSARMICQSKNTPIAHMIDKGLSRIGRPVNEISQNMENIGRLEVANLEKRTGFLGIISGAAPMLGLLGTVIGMIRTFYNMSQNTTGGVEISQLSGGVYEAMINTAAGLGLGFAAYLGYNLLVSMTNRTVNKMEAFTIEFIDILQDPMQ
jgi:biopolymer transport protein ExbB